MLELLRRPFASAAAWVARQNARDPQATRVVGVLGFLALLCVVRLFGDDPWSDGIAERLEEGKHLRPVDYMRTYGWWAALINLAGLALAIGTRRYWLDRRVPELVAALESRADPARRRLFALAVLGAMATLAVLGAPRLGHSFWDDEEYSLHHAIHGSYVRKPSGELDFDRARLRDTLWHFHKPSNHVPQSLLSRFSNQIWRGVASPDARFANETATRLPVFMAGLLALAAPAYLLRRLGFASAGVLVAWLLALHPWHLRYSTEARGYALLLLFVPTLLLLLSRAIEHGTTRRWVGYGLAQLVLVWAFPAAVFILLVTNTIAIAWIFWTQRSRAGRVGQLQGFVMANVLGAMLAVFLMLPNFFQLLAFLDRDDLARLDAAKFLTEVLSHLWIGTSWRISVGAERFVDAVDLRAAAPGLFRVLLAVSIAAAALGALRLALGGKRALPIALALLLPAPLTLGFALARETYLNQWYLVFALPSVAVFLTLGLTWPAAWLERRGGAAGPVVALLLGVAFLAPYGWLTHEKRESLRAGPLQPIRESVALTRPVRDPFDPRNRDVVTVSFQAPPLYYDPLVRVISGPRELRPLMREADERGTTLFVNYGRPRLAERRYGPLIELLGRSDLFTLEAELVGSSPRGVRRVYRYVGTSP